MAEKKKKKKKKGKKTVFTTGKRKRAVARATLKPGKGIIKINSKPINLLKNKLVRLRVQEPVMLAGEGYKNYDIKVTVKGGGFMGQAEAARQAIARALVKVMGSDLKETYLNYDRNLLVYDPRRTEPHKPPLSSKGPRKYKQRSKR